MFQYICNSYNNKLFIDVIDITPDLPSNRGEEIKNYIDMLENLETFVIIDDVDDGISDLFYNEFVHTSSDYGYGLPDYIESLRVLK